MWIFLLLFFVACSQPKEQLAINIPNFEPTSDPRMVVTLADHTGWLHLYEGLYRSGKPALCESSEVSEDGLTWTFHLRPSYWSDGSPLVAEDFASAWRESVSPYFLGNFAGLSYTLKNGEAIKQGKLPIESLGVKTVDPSTLVVTLEYPCPYLADLLSQPVFLPQKKGLFNGPYFLQKNLPLDHCILAKNPYYWNAEQVKLASLRFNLADNHSDVTEFTAQTIAWAGSPTSDLGLDEFAAQKNSPLLCKTPASTCISAYFNVTKGPLANAKLRKALGLAIDRKAICEQLFSGLYSPASSLVPTPFLPATQKVEENWAKAQQYLAEAILELGQTPTLTIHVSGYEIQRKLAEVLCERWKQLGIEIHIDRMELMAWRQKRNALETDITFIGWVPDYPDAMSYLEIFTRLDGSNKTGWSDAPFTALIDEAKYCTDNAKRLTLLSQAEDILLESACLTPICHTTWYSLKAPNLVDVKMIPQMGVVDFSEASFKL